jgi:small subunit ribosomal protein S7
MRGKQAPKRKIAPDPKYNNLLIAKLINRVMLGGKKVVARKIVYGALDIIEEKIKKNGIELQNGHKTPLDVFEQAIRNITPVVEVKGRRVGGANYQVPIPVRGDRRFYLAYKWVLDAARARKGRPMAEKLAYELIDIYNNTGSAIKVKQNVERMAEANRAFAHFAR